MHNAYSVCDRVAWHAVQMIGEPTKDLIAETCRNARSVKRREREGVRDRDSERVTAELQRTIKLSK